MGNAHSILLVNYWWTVKTRKLYGREILLQKRKNSFSATIRVFLDVNFVDILASNTMIKTIMVLQFNYFRHHLC